MKDRYVKNTEAGDQVVGRTVSGLNVCTVEYIVSPPFFDVHVHDVAEDEWLGTDALV